jgi:hypothetical protein
MPIALSISSVPIVDGVPAQKRAMVSPSFESSSGLIRRALFAAAMSQGFPIITHGPGASSTIARPSQGLAGA